MRSLYESIMDDDETVISRTKESGLRFSVDQMLNTGEADKKLIRKLESKVAIYPATNDNIKDIVEKYIKLVGKNCSLNWIDTSKVTDMKSLFSPLSSITTSQFSGDISKWDVSNVRYMDYMFSGSKKFNGNISNWDVSNVVSMSYMFNSSNFNGNISNWDVSNVRDMAYMFYHSDFNKDISKWDVSNVTDMSHMFMFSDFVQDISKWNVKKVVEYEDIFAVCPISSDHKPKFR